MAKKKIVSGKAKKIDFKKRVLVSNWPAKRVFSRNTGWSSANSKPGPVMQAVVESYERKRMGMESSAHADGSGETF